MLQWNLQGSNLLAVKQNVLKFQSQGFVDFEEETFLTFLTEAMAVRIYQAWREDPVSPSLGKQKYLFYYLVEASLNEF